MTAKCFRRSVADYGNLGSKALMNQSSIGASISTAQAFCQMKDCGERINRAQYVAILIRLLTTGRQHCGRCGHEVPCKLNDLSQNIL